MRSHEPPGWAVWLLGRFVPGDEVDAVVGDLVEAARAERRSAAWLLGQCLLFAVSFGWARMRDGVGRVREVRTPGEILRGGGMTMDGWTRDLRVAIRALLRRPGFSIVVIATLGLGIGANTAIFSVIHGAMLSPLDYPEPDRLLWLSDGYRDWGRYGSSMNLLNVLDMKEQATLVESMEAYTFLSVNFAGADRPERVQGLAVGPDFLRTLGLRPSLGRDFTPEENVRGAAEAVILTDELWRDRFGADPGVVGSTVTLDATPATVIGVVPPAFEFRGDPRFFISLKYDGTQVGRGGRGHNAVARMKPGVTVEAAREELRTIFARLEKEYPESNENWQTWAEPFDAWIVGRAADSLRLMAVAVGLVLLIACVNVANLLLVRAESRQRELAVRAALGAGRGGLLPVFLSESVILALAGGAVGLGLAWFGVPALVGLYGSSLPRADAIGLNGTVLGFGLGVSLLTGLVVGVLPALRTGLVDLQGQLKEGTRAVSRGGARLRQALVVIELALAMILVAGAGLLVNSFWRLTSVDAGLADPEQVLVAQLTLSSGSYGETEAVIGFYRDLMDAVQSAPGVRAAGITSRLPLNGGFNITDLFVHNDEERVSHFVELRSVTPGFFDAAGLSIVAGRGLTDADGEEATNVVVTQELARQLFGGEEDAVGGFIRPGYQEEPLQIVGVASDTRDMGLHRAPPPGMYFALGSASARRGAIVLVRTDGDPLDVLPRVREAVTRLDPTIPVFGTRLLSDVVARSVGSRRFSMSLLALFAGLALLLGAVGVYGVMSYTVEERTREMGVRLALGAAKGDVVGLVLRGGLQLTALGLVLGAVGGIASARFVSEMLYEVDAADPLTHGTVAVLLVAIAMAACWLPARRASAVDPVEALRHQ